MGLDLKMGSLVHLPHIIVIAKLLNAGFVLFELITPHLVLYILILFGTRLILFLHKKLPKRKCGYIIVIDILFGIIFFEVPSSVPKRRTADHSCIVTHKTAPQLRVH